MTSPTELYTDRSDPHPGAHSVSLYNTWLLTGFTLYATI